MAPRKTGASGSDDPERESSTKVKKPTPRRAGPRQPEGNEDQTSPNAPNDLDDGTAPNPPPSRPARRKRRDGTVEVSQSLQEESGLGDGEYHTGRKFRELLEQDAEAAVEPGTSLEGDGLDPMDPEMLPRTRQLPLDGDEEGEASMVGAEPSPDDVNATRAGPPVHLEVIAGPDAGKKRKFRSVRMVVGRAPGCDFQLTDQSVSRRHVELVHGDGGTVLRDLGSGNGSKVNGERVDEKLLQHGDEIFVGHSLIRFVDEAAAYQQAREEAEQASAAAAHQEIVDGGAAAAPPGARAGDSDDALAEQLLAAEQGDAPEATATDDEPDRSVPVKTARGASAKKSGSPVRMLVIGFVVLTALIAGVLIATRKKEPPVEELNLAKAEAKMQQARTAARENKFEEALATATEAESLSHGIDKSNLASSAREEIAVQKALEDARGFLEKKQFEDVRKILVKAPHGSGRLDEERSKIEADVIAAELQYFKDQIDEYLATGDLEPAQRLLSSLPIEERGLSAKKVAEFEAQLAQIKRDEANASRANAAAAAAKKKQAREEELFVAFSSVERKFAGSEWDRAASECMRVVELHQGDQELMHRAQRLMGQIPNFGRAFDEGMRKYRAGQQAPAAKPLRTALGLYGQMNLRQNTFSTELGEALGQASLAAGREALIRNDLMSAAQNFRDVVRLDPSEPKGQQGLDDTIARAEDLFREAHSQRDSDPREALRKFRVVVEVVPAGTPTNDKAKAQIAALSQ